MILSRKALISNLVFMCICHLLSTAAFLPFLSLQSSLSIWVQSLTNSGFEFNTGSLLSSEVFAVAAVTALLAPCVIRVLSTSVIVAVCYGQLNKISGKNRNTYNDLFTFSLYGSMFRVPFTSCALRYHTYQFIAWGADRSAV